MLPLEPSKSARETFKVLHVAETLPGGIATYLNEILPGQCRALGVGQVHVLAPSDQLNQLQDDSGAVRHGYRRTGRNAKSFLSLALALRQCCQELRPDIVHLHSSFAGTIGRFLGPLLAGRPRVVYCAHGWAFSRDDKVWLRRVYVAIERALASRADAWVAISRHELEVAAVHRIRSDHARLIYNGIGDIEEQPISDRLGYEPDQLNLLFVGRHDRQKGLDILLEAMRQLSDSKVHLNVAGLNVFGTKRSEEAGSNVSYLGWLNRDELIAHYSACDVVVMPSRWEGFGLVAIEAMRARKAVIGARVGALVEIIDDGKTGRLAPSGDPAALAQIIGQVSRDELVSWGARGRIKFVERYNIARVNEQLLDLYTFLMQGR